MTGMSLAFSPAFPLWLLAALAVLAIGLTVFGMIKRSSGVIPRALSLALLLVVLANPELHRENRSPLDDTVLVMVDRSASQNLRDRPQQLEDALAELRQELDGETRLKTREISVEAGDRRGTVMFQRLQEAMGEVDRNRLAGVIALTDGQIHDVPTDTEALGIDVPFHTILTGNPGERDRQLVIEQAPSFSMVGEAVDIVVRVDEIGGESSASIPLTVRQDGQEVDSRLLRPGQSDAISIVLSKAGESVIEIEAGSTADELTEVNNRKALFINGIRDRLRVLLISGQPYQGLRVWRNLLKADPAVDLVHFTILRPPEKQDGTPIRELALIAFPSRELFEIKLTEFDLVIFDRYARRGLLPLVYLDNVARYVENGGAVLEAAGPEFASPMSLYRTPLSRVLPGRPSGEVYERDYLPTVTETGQLHPVTSGLAPLEGDPDWGSWYRQVDVESTGGQVLMNGVADRPLLILERVGEGRVAQLLSDNVWLWARGLEDGGPHATLLRRLVHWLMREPELEEEALKVEALEGGLIVERQSLNSETIEVEITEPGGTSRRVQLEPEIDGIARARIEATDDGLYRVTDGERTAYAVPRPISQLELTGMIATTERLAPIAEATGGSISWFAETGVPDIRRIEPGRRTTGRGWIGLHDNDAHSILSVSRTPMIPAWVALVLVLGTLAYAWWREGRAT